MLRRQLAVAELVLRMGCGDGAERVDHHAEHDRKREPGGARQGHEARERLALGLLRHQEDLAVDVAGLDQLERVGVVEGFGLARLGEEPFGDLGLLHEAFLDTEQGSQRAVARVVRGAGEPGCSKPALRLLLQELVPTELRGGA